MVDTGNHVEVGTSGIYAGRSYELTFATAFATPLIEEKTVGVKYLDPVVTGVNHINVAEVTTPDLNASRLCELTCPTAPYGCRSGFEGWYNGGSGIESRG